MKRKQKRMKGKQSESQARKWVKQLLVNIGMRVVGRIVSEFLWRVVTAPQRTFTLLTLWSILAGPAEGEPPMFQEETAAVCQEEEFDA
jgi:hypothetical protein